MGRSTTVTCSLFAVLFARLSLGTPTGTEPIEARQAVGNVATVTPSPSLVPEVVKHGVLDKAAIDALVALSTSNKAPAVGEVLDAGKNALTAVPLLRARQTTSTNGPFLSYLNGNALPNADPNCPEFQVDGPIVSLEAFMGSSNFRGLKLRSIAGNETDILGDLTNTLNPGVFEFGPNERITEFFVKERTKSRTVVDGFTFKTDAGKTYAATSMLITPPGLGSPPKVVEATDVSIPVGAGIIARIRGTKCDTGILGSFGIDFLDELASIQITNITYSGFTNNIAPSGPGSTLSVGSVILDNRNSSIQQSMSLTTSDAITTSSSITTTLSWKVGASVSVKAEASVPFLAKTEVSGTTSWEINPSTADTELTSSTLTRSATFNLACPAKKFCVGSASFTSFKLDVNLEATFSAVTKSGQTYNWVQKGTYKGADSLALKLKIDEVDSV